MSESDWKIGFFIVFLLWIFVRMIYGKAANRCKAKKEIKPTVESLLAALNLIGMVFLPLTAVFTSYLDSYKMNLPGYVRAIALFVSMINVGFFLKVHRELGKNWSKALVIKEGHTLVVSGIYEKVRHPMYTHLWTWIITQGFILDNWLVGVFGVVAWALFYFDRVPREEEMLTEEFGDEYREYMHTTGRLFPRLFSKKVKNIHTTAS